MVVSFAATYSLSGGSARPRTTSLPTTTSRCSLLVRRRPRLVRVAPAPARLPAGPPRAVPRLVPSGRQFRAAAHLLRTTHRVAFLFCAQST
eukprot:scaffold55661_cov69-Phaeocystis_antarctica.AAC.1